MDGLFEGEPADDPAVDLTRRIVEKRLGYDRVRGVCAVAEAREPLDGLRGRATELADEVGLVDHEALRESLPDSGRDRLFELAVQRSGLVRIGDRLALRSTKRARVKAAILSIGRPASLDEIVAKSGLPRAHLGGLLSDIPGVARATKTKWGIEDWIDDAYGGIVAGIVQRIEEDGGATPMDRLVRELPELFEVKEGSVRSLVATLQFVLSDGMVRLGGRLGGDPAGRPRSRPRRDPRGMAVLEIPRAREVLRGLQPGLRPARDRRSAGMPAQRQGRRRPCGVPPVAAESRSTGSSRPRPARAWATSRRRLRSLGVVEGDLVRMVVVGRGVVEFR